MLKIIDDARGGFGNIIEHSLLISLPINMINTNVPITINKIFNGPNQLRKFISCYRRSSEQLSNIEAVNFNL